MKTFIEFMWLNASLAFMVLVSLIIVFGLISWVSPELLDPTHLIAPTARIDSTETIRTVHVSIQPGQVWDKEFVVSELPDSIDIIRIEVTAQECRTVRSL